MTKMPSHVKRAIDEDLLIIIGMPLSKVRSSKVYLTYKGAKRLGACSKALRFWRDRCDETLLVNHKNLRRFSRYNVEEWYFKHYEPRNKIEKAALSSLKWFKGQEISTLIMIKIMVIYQIQRKRV